MRLDWRYLLALYIGVLLFVTPNVYSLPSVLPFDLQISRIVAMIILGLWATALLIDPNVRLPKTALDRPLLALGAVATLSLLFNGRALVRAGELEAAIKSLLYLVSIIFIFYFTATAVVGARDVVWVLRLVVAFVAVIALSGIVERYTGFNAFRHLHDYIPVLEYHPYRLWARGGLRIAGSAEHPIALGALFAMTLPLLWGLYGHAKTNAGRWLLAGCALVIVTSLAFTVSRSAVIGVAVGIGIVVLYDLRKPSELVKYGVFLLVVLAGVHMAAPGTIGTIISAFNPEEGLLASQGGMGGRIGRYPVIWSRFMQGPLIGVGFEMFNPKKNFYIDNEYLKLLLETGVLGLGALLWLFKRLATTLWRSVERIPESDAPLLVGVFAACTVYMVETFFYDTLGFSQTTYLFFILASMGLTLIAGIRAAEEIEGGASDAAWA